MGCNDKPHQNTNSNKFLRFRPFQFLFKKLKLKSKLFYCTRLKTYVVCAHQNCLAEAILMSTHNTGLPAEIRTVCLRNVPPNWKLTCNITGVNTNSRFSEAISAFMDSLISSSAPIHNDLLLKYELHCKQICPLDSVLAKMQISMCVYSKWKESPMFPLWKVYGP